MLIDAAVFVRDHQPMTKKNECGRLSSLARVSRSHGSARDAVEAYLVRVCSMLSRISVTLSKGRRHPPSKKLRYGEIVLTGAEQRFVLCHGRSLWRVAKALTGPRKTDVMYHVLWELTDSKSFQQLMDCWKIPASPSHHSSSGPTAAARVVLNLLQLGVSLTSKGDLLLE